MTQNNEQNSSLDNADFRKVLKENEALRKELNLVLWASKSATWKWNYETNHLAFNEQKASSIDFEKDELGFGYEAFTDLVHADDYENVMQAMRDLISGKNDVYDVIYRIKTKSGTYRWFHDKGRITSFQDNGKPLFIEGVAIDITEEKELRVELEKSENQFEFFFNSNPTATFVWQKKSSDFVLVEVNNASNQITDNKAKGFVGKTLKSIYPDLPEIIDKINECYKNKSTIHFESHYLTRHSGKYIWVNYRLAFQEPDFVLMYADIITDKKNAAQALKDSEAKSTALLNVIPDLMFRLDSESIVLDYKADKKDLYAQEIKDLVGVKLIEYLPESIAKKTTQYIHKALKEDKIQYYTYQLDVPNSGICSYEARMIPSGEDEVTAIIRDVTEWENTKKSLKDNQARSKALLDAIPDLMFRIGRNGDYIDYKAPISDLVVQDVIIIGKNIMELLPEDVAGKSMKVIEKVLQTGEMVSYEYELLVPGKGLRYFEARVVPSGKDEVITLVRDITKQKQEESELVKLRTAIEQSHAGVVITDFDGLIEYINEAFTIISGYEHDELIGKNPSVLSAGTKPESDYIELWDTIKSGETWVGEFHNKRGNGELYWDKSIISPIKNDRGEITHFVGIKEDITDLKRLVAELKHAKEKAEESDRLKSAFLTNMSHEIRTPLNALVGFSTLIASKTLSEEKLNKYRNLISKNSSRLLNVINDILDISKIEAGQFELNMADVNIYDEINNIGNSIKTSLHEKSRELNLKIDCDQLGVIIHADVLRFRQILMNLLSNAIKFTDRGYVKVGYKIVEKDVVFFVKDTGLGIPKGMQKIIFDRFKQARYEDGRFFGGTGLGLPIAKAYTEMMGGKMWVESEEGRGTTFYFTLPL